MRWVITGMLIGAVLISLGMASLELVLVSLVVGLIALLNMVLA